MPADADPISDDRSGGWLFFAIGAVASFILVIAIALPIVVLGVVDSGGGATPAAAEPGDAPAALDGEELYLDRCAGCHGDDGEGGAGPPLAGRVAEAYPDIADQIAVIVDGRAAMPAFGGTLTAEEIEAVANYERTDLGS